MIDLATSAPWLTLLPPVLAIVLVIATKRVLLSLGVGVVSAALLVNGLDPLATIASVWQAFAVIFWDDGAINAWYVGILAFVVMLGIITAFIMMSGGTRAFAEWAVRRIRGRRGALLLPAVLGLVIFIDDYFNALAVGQVSRPVTDRHRVSRAKLAYIIDSTSAPVSVLAPFSSWGAYILGVIAPIVAASALPVSGLAALVGASVANYYAIAAVLLVWLVIAFRIDIGPMRREERRAIVDGQPFDPSETVPGQLSDDLPEHRPGAKHALALPFIALVVGILAGIVGTGWRASGSADLLEILAATDASMSLVIGGVLGLAAAVVTYLRTTRRDPSFSPATFWRGTRAGVKAMLPALGILIPAWMLGDLVAQLGTGDYLGGLLEDASMPAAWLVPVVFLVAAGMAFATGTSWGSFGLLLPLAGGIIEGMGASDMLLPAFGAVLAGAVAGDHASPISDTTILSSTGSGSSVATHVVTQLPYAVCAAVCAGLGYVALALTGSVAAGLAVTVVGLAAFVVLAKTLLRPVEAAQPA